MCCGQGLVWAGPACLYIRKGIVGDDEAVCVVDRGWYGRVQHVCI